MQGLRPSLPNQTDGEAMIPAGGTENNLDTYFCICGELRWGQESDQSTTQLSGRFVTGMAEDSATTARQVLIRVGVVARAIATAQDLATPIATVYIQWALGN